MFKLKRAHQMEAAESITKIEDYSKQYKLLTVVMEKIFKVSHAWTSYNIKYIMYS